VTEPDLVSTGVQLSRRRARKWAPGWQVLYAALVTAGWLAIVGTAVILVVLVAGGATLESTALFVALVVVAVVGVVVMSWLFWNFAVTPMADLATAGAFSRYRARRLVRFDKYFSRAALAMLIVIPFIPFVQIFD